MAVATETCTACGKEISAPVIVDGQPYGSTCARTTARGILASTRHLAPERAAIEYRTFDGDTTVPADCVGTVTTSNGNVHFHRGDGDTVTLTHDDTVRILTAVRPQAAADIIQAVHSRGADHETVAALVDQLTPAGRAHRPLPARLPDKAAAFPSEDAIVITRPGQPDTEVHADDLIWNLTVTAPHVAADVFTATANRISVEDFGELGHSFFTGRGGPDDEIAERIWARAGWQEE